MNESNRYMKESDAWIHIVGMLPVSTAKGKKGSWITLTEWKWHNEKKAYIPVCVKTEQIDGVRIKEDTFYKLENGEFVEADE